MAPVPKKSITDDHFTHPGHSLTPVNNDREYLCDGCKTMGSGKRYRCIVGCDFDMHEYCRTCPRKLSNFMQQHGEWWLLQQAWEFVIIGVGDAFALVGLQEYFYGQVPDSMRSLGIAFYLSVIGASSLVSSLLITLVDCITDKGGTSWFGEDLNSSRIDYFYWLLASITAGNLCIFTFFAMRYTYKNVIRTSPADVADRYKGDGIESVA